MSGGAPVHPPHDRATRSLSDTQATPSYPPDPSRRYPASVYTEHLHIPVGVGTLHVERRGRGGPAVVLLHGFATCAFLWRDVAPRLAAAGLTTVAIDLLGHGESDRPADALYGASAQADYVDRALTALRLGEVTVVTQDAGALVGALLASHRPTRVRSLALVEPLDPEELPGPMIRAMQRSSALSALSANALFGARPLLEPWLLERLGDAAEPDRLVARYLAPFVGSAGAAELLQLASHVMLSDTERRRLADVAVDTHLWLGRGDPLEASAVVISETLRPATLPHSIGTRGLFDRWSALLPASSVQARVATTPPGALVAEVSASALADVIREIVEPGIPSGSAPANES
ncbi:MAG TPA: hypothetical protein DGD08_14170 [Gemmatimonas aurantiaca]|nr:hypothetical protein [Gemmatimonas aurantiaca]